MNKAVQQLLRLITFLLIAAQLSGCSVHQSQAKVGFAGDARWVVLPFENHSETPRASERVEALTLAALRSQKVQAEVAETHDDSFELPTFNGKRRYTDAIEYARSMGMTYGVTGSVVEWRYKSGLDGEPAVGIAMHVVDIPSGNTLWSASFSRSGWSRESLSGTGQKVISKLISGMLKG